MKNKLLCKAGLNFDFFINLKEEVTLHKTCEWDLVMKIADGNCRWSALEPLEAGNIDKVMNEYCEWNLFSIVNEVPIFGASVSTHLEQVFV